MEKLLGSVNALKRTEVKSLVDTRMEEFGKERCPDELFKELCFCLLTANFNAERSIRIQDEIGNGFLTLKRESLAKKLKSLGHRFPNARADYIVSARAYKSSLKSDREWLVANIKGIGYKEASHFLRNTGHTDYAIIDFHIIDLLVRSNILRRPKTLTKSTYLKIESKLRELSRKSNLNLSQLDLYLWYLETGKVLK